MAGVPIHPHTKHFAPLLQDLKRQLPSDTALLLLSPPYVLVSSPKPFHRLWSFLSSHFMSLVPPVSPEPSNGDGATGSSSKPPASTPTVITAQSNGALVTTSNHRRNLPSLSSMDAILRANGSATISFLTTIPNVKKWANVLTFRQPSSSPPLSGPSSSAMPPPPDRSDDKALDDPQPPSSRAGGIASSSSSTESGAVQLVSSLSTPSIDQTSLTEAIASTNQGLLCLPEPDLHRPLQQQLQVGGTASRVVSIGQEQVQSQPLPMFTPAMSYVDAPGARIDGLPTAESLPSIGPSPVPSPSLHAFEPGSDNPIQEEKICPLEATPSQDEKKEPGTSTDAVEETPVAFAPPIPLPPPEAFFIPGNVHLEDPETRALRMRRAYHMSVGPMRRCVS